MVLVDSHDPPLTSLSSEVFLLPGAEESPPSPMWNWQNRSTSSSSVYGLLVRRVGGGWAVMVFFFDAVGDVGEGRSEDGVEDSLPPPPPITISTRVAERSSFGMQDGCV